MLASELLQYIYEQDKVEYILDKIGCHSISSSAKEWRCGLPNHRNKTSVVVKNSESLKSKIYKPNDATVKGDLITITMDILELKFVDTLKYLHSLLNLTYTYESTKVEKKQTPLDIFQKHKKKGKVYSNINEVEIHNELTLMEYVPNLHLSWLREGIISSIAREFNIGFDTKSSRIVIPHRKFCGEDNEYVGIVGRSVLDNNTLEILGIPKYFPLIPYPKGLNLYGLQENYKYIQNDDIVFVGESEKYVLKNASRGLRNCVALCCHDVTDEQLRILIGLDVTEVVIDLDKGISEYHIWSICDRLYGIRKVSYVWDKYDILEDKESSSDKHLKVNNWLRNNRIEYTEWHHKKFLEEKEKRNGR